MWVCFGYRLALWVVMLRLVMLVGLLANSVGFAG